MKVQVSRLFQLRYRLVYIRVLLVVLMVSAAGALALSGASYARHDKHASINPVPKVVSAAAVTATNDPATAVPDSPVQNSGSEPAQWTITKSGIVKVREKTLVISPASLTLYKNVSGAQGVKDGITNGVITVRTGDGGLGFAPRAQGVTDIYPSATNLANASSWTMNVQTDYTTLGTHTVTLESVSPDATVHYTGTFQVTVVAMPSFKVSNTPGGSATITSGNYMFEGLNYTDDNDGAYLPTVSLQPISGFDCDAYLVFTSSRIQCAASVLPAAGNYTLSFVFENKFQRVPIAAWQTILPY